MNTQQRKHTLSGRPFLASSLVVCYLFAHVLAPDLWIHLLQDPLHKVLHSAEHENNPCHRSIYHHDTDHGCQHESHITSDDACSLHHTYTHWLHLPAKTPSIEKKTTPIVLIACIQLSFPEEKPIRRASRAPPIH